MIENREKKVDCKNTLKMKIDFRKKLLIVFFDASAENKGLKETTFL